MWSLELINQIKADAEKMTLDEFTEAWTIWLFPIWEKNNKMPDHDEQLFGDDDEKFTDK